MNRPNNTVCSRVFESNLIVTEVKRKSHKEACGFRENVLLPLHFKCLE